MRAALLLVFPALAACSGLTTYPTDAGGNLAVRTHMDSSVRAALHIHRVDAKCQTRYAGTVALDAPSVSLSLPAGQPSYVVVAFDTSSFLGGRRSTSAGTFFTPRPGSRYELNARYRDDIYDVALVETDARGRRTLPRRDTEACGLPK
jgi:hypothetical protein